MAQIQSESLLLQFDDETGALNGVRARKTGWDILSRPKLGLSWQLLVPVNEELRNNPVYGEKQRLSGIKQGDGFLELTWDGVVSEKAGQLDITVTVRVEAKGEQILWNTRIENHSPYVVEDALSPYLGDVHHPKDADWFKTFSAVYASARETSLWPRFDNLIGYFGVDYPNQYGGSIDAGAPMSPFMLLRSERQGLYVGVAAPSSELVCWNAELRPGWDESISQRVPEMDEIGGHPVHTRFAPVHMCYIVPGETRDLTPIALQAYSGGWQDGVDIYRAWKDTWSFDAKIPDWAKEPHSWQQLHINSPEDELRLRFTELPEVARECAERGVRAIQLVGWNDGGQDQGNPSHDPDPRLGTFDELKNAIAECQAMGVKIVLFAKFTWADRATERFRNELIHSAVKDPYGDYYMHGGYHYQTPAQLLNINTKRLIPMCFADPHYMDVCRTEFRKFIELGCDGFLFDECLHHTPAQLCFDPSHGHRVPWPVYSNDRQFIYELMKEEGLREDFLFAGEAVYDWEVEAYAMSYHRSENKRHIALSRYMRPFAQFMTAVTGFNDRSMINQCLQHRYIISYEPYNFKGRLPDFPETVAYGQKMDALRAELRKWLWDGEYLGVRGRCETLTGDAYEAFSAFRADDGSEMMVLVNYEDQEVALKAVLPSGAAATNYRTIDGETWHSAADGIVLPPLSAAVVR